MKSKQDFEDYAYSTLCSHIQYEYVNLHYSIRVRNSLKYKNWASVQRVTDERKENPTINKVVAVEYSDWHVIDLSGLSDRDRTSRHDGDHQCVEKHAEEQNPGLDQLEPNAQPEWRAYCGSGHDGSAAKAVGAAEYFASNEGHIGVRHVLRDDAELMNKSKIIRSWL